MVYTTNCDNLMEYTTNPKATSKIAKQRAIDHNPTKESKRSKKNQLIKKKANREK